jgi:hypothetical protein
MYICLPLLAGGEPGHPALLDGPPGSQADAARMTEKASWRRFSPTTLVLVSPTPLRESMRNLSIRDPLTGLFNVVTWKRP